MLTLVLVVVGAALVFEFINGFHDTANSIAASVATKVLSPGQAVILAAVMNLIGALTGTAVAATIATGIVNTDVVEATSQLVLCALSGAIAWNLLTWWFGLPATLMGGIRRVWAPGIAQKRGGIPRRRRGELKRLRHLLAITTIGAPAWLDFLTMRRPLQIFFLKFIIIHIINSNNFYMKIGLQ